MRVAPRLEWKWGGEIISESEDAVASKMESMPQYYARGSGMGSEAELDEDWKIWKGHLSKMSANEKNKSFYTDVGGRHRADESESSQTQQRLQQSLRDKNQGTWLRELSCELEDL